MRSVFSAILFAFFLFTQSFVSAIPINGNAPMRREALVARHNLGDEVLPTLKSVDGLSDELIGMLYAQRLQGIL